jgi:hypothetical protein
LPEVHGYGAHKDLVRAIKQVDAAYAASVSLDIFKAEETWNSNRNIPIPNQSQLSTLLADFLRYYRTTNTRKTNILGGVFGATLNGQGSPYNKKRSRDNAKPSKPCLCGDNHFWGQCLYIDIALRTRGFVEDPEKAKKVALFEAADTGGILNKIREKNRRYKKHKSKDTDKRAESDSIEIDACTKHMPSSHLHSTISYLSDTIRFSTYGLSTPQLISTSAITTPNFSGRLQQPMTILY